MSQYLDEIGEILGPERESLLTYTCWGIPSDMLVVPGPDFVDRKSVV